MNSNGEKRRLFLFVSDNWTALKPVYCSPPIFVFPSCTKKRNTDERRKTNSLRCWRKCDVPALYLSGTCANSITVFISLHSYCSTQKPGPGGGRGGFWQNPTHQFHPESRRPRMVLCRAEIDSGSSSPRSHAGGSSPGGVKKWTNRVSCNQSPAVFSWWHQSETASLRGNDPGGQKYSTFLRVSSTAVILR